MSALPRRRGAAEAVLLGGLLLASLLLASLPNAALAQSAANPNDQPTAGTLPPGTDTVRGGDRAAERPTGDVSAPSAIRPSTSVMPEGKTGKPVRTNPMDHLSEPFRTKYEK